MAERKDLRATFLTLTLYTRFREALPFLKGDRCGIGDDVYRDIVARLNGSGSPGEVKDDSQWLKAEEVGRKHQKGQAKSTVAPAAESVRAGLQAALAAATAGGEASAEVRRLLGDAWLLRLAQWCLTADDTPFESADDGTGLGEPYGPLAVVRARVGKASREDRAGFRKAVGVEGADLFNALRSDGVLNQWRAGRAVRLHV